MVAKLREKGNVIDGTTEALPFTAPSYLPLYLFARNSLNTSVTMYCIARHAGLRLPKQTGEVVMEATRIASDSDGDRYAWIVCRAHSFANNGTGDAPSLVQRLRLHPSMSLSTMLHSQRISSTTWYRKHIYQLGYVQA